LTPEQNRKNYNRPIATDHCRKSVDSICIFNLLRSSWSSYCLLHHGAIGSRGSRRPSSSQDMGIFSTITSWRVCHKPQARRNNLVQMLLSVQGVLEPLAPEEPLTSDGYTQASTSQVLLLMMFIDTETSVTQLVYERSRMHANRTVPLAARVVRRNPKAPLQPRNLSLTPVNF
jgi:hypothetical protein